MQQETPFSFEFVQGQNVSQGHVVRGGRGGWASRDLPDHLALSSRMQPEIMIPQSCLGAILKPAKLHAFKLFELQRAPQKCFKSISSFQWKRLQTQLQQGSVHICRPSDPEGWHHFRVTGLSSVPHWHRMPPHTQRVTLAHASWPATHTCPDLEIWHDHVLPVQKETTISSGLTGCAMLR